MSKGSMRMSVNGTDVIVIDEEGMYYKGELVEDAGVAYGLFLKVLEHMHEELSDCCAE